MSRSPETRKYTDKATLVIEVLAYCPKCERDHLIKKPWTGKGKPRYFCERCSTNERSKQYYHKNKDKIIAQRKRKNHEDKDSHGLGSR